MLTTDKCHFPYDPNAKGAKNYSEIWQTTARKHTERKQNIATATARVQLSRI